MNEEELENEIIDKLLSERFDKPVKNGTMPCVIFSRQEFIKGMKYCFQKGKLEERERILKIVLRLKENNLNNPIYVPEFIEQLQKEIGEEKGK